MNRIAMCACSLVAVSACKKHGNWESARSNYCDNVDLLRSEVNDAIDAWVKRLEEIPGQDAADQLRFCDNTRENLGKLVSKIEGFTLGAGALAFGRVEDSVEKAGLTLTFGREPLATFVLDAECRAGAPSPQLATKLRAAGEKALKEFDEGLANCRAIGWTSALNPNSGSAPPSPKP